MVFKDRKITTKEYDFDLPEAQFTAINDRCWPSTPRSS